MNNWIPVTENLPSGNGQIYAGCLEESELVLVYGLDDNNEASYGMGTYIRDHSDRVWRGFSEWNGYMHCDTDLGYCKVTHWMPLPEPPTKQV